MISITPQLRNDILELHKRTNPLNFINKTKEVTMRTTITGDIRDTVNKVMRDHPDKNIVLVHGCNCQNNMGAGLARRIKDIWPQAEVADMLSARGNVDKLGTFTMGVIEDNFVILNLYTQFYYGGNKVHLDYEALESGLRLMVDKINSDSVVFLIPANIGCGLAGGDINRVTPIIEKQLENCNYYLFDI